MADNKTQPTDVPVSDYLAAITDEQRRQDCQTLVEMMSDITREPPVMWGTGIVGFGSYHYRYESGREGEMCLTGFASRKSDISVYLMALDAQQLPMLRQLGKHKAGKSCLYIRRLADVDLDVLRRLIAVSVAETRAVHTPADIAPTSGPRKKPPK
ncbi:MAG: DUF1801 domain-containing protein [Planctomycetaceae bacterium]|nr:DUF1801 domain-containing protein [Planctomycetaceae bacterium]